MANCEFCKYFKKKLTQEKQVRTKGNSNSTTEAEKSVSQTENLVKEEEKKKVGEKNSSQPEISKIYHSEEENLKTGFEILQQQIDELKKEVLDLKKSVDSLEFKTR